MGHGREFDSSGNFIQVPDHSATSHGHGVFPWLSAAQRKKVDLANYFVSQTIRAAHLAFEVGAFFLIEHPEDLGTVNGEAPASIWQLDEMHDLQIVTNATTWAIFQCGYGADTSKPTRFLSSIPGIKARFSKWPAFDEQGKICGGHCLLGAPTRAMSGVLLARTLRGAGSQDPLPHIHLACANTWPTSWSPSFGKGAPTR